MYKNQALILHIIIRVFKLSKKFKKLIENSKEMIGVCFNLLFTTTKNIETFQRNIYTGKEWFRNESNVLEKVDRNIL